MSIYRRKLMMAYAANLGRGDIVYPGLIAAWSAKGKTNEDADRNVLKDLTGNGHDITLNNFAFSGMSGYGGYIWDFKKFSDGSTNQRDIIREIINDHAIKVTKAISTAFLYLTGFTSSNFIIRIQNKPGNVKIKCGNTRLGMQELSNGNNIIKINFNNEAVGFKFDTFENEDIIIELLPEYPDALVFDGVDDYGSAVDFGDTTYVQTIIIKYLAMSSSPYKSYSYIRGDNSSGYFRMNNKKNIDEEPFIRAAVLPHNIYIKKDTDYFEKANWDTNKYEPYNINGYSKGREIGKMAFYSAYLFDRSLDEQEIKAFIRKYIDPEYLLPSEQVPTPDCYYDFSQGSNDDENRDTIKDLSGNGNDAKAYNFAWNEEGSGYKDGALYLDGTDDYIALEAFDSGFKTVFMLCSWKIENVINYDQRNNNDYENALNTSSQDINYYGRNRSGKTYINGILSTKVKNNLTRNKKHLITGTFFGGSNTTTPCIGSNNSGNGYFSNLTLYKFLGFKEELTEEQIKAIIKKYNLLDGVDNIN